MGVSLWSTGCKFRVTGYKFLIQDTRCKIKRQVTSYKLQVASKEIKYKMQRKIQDASYKTKFAMTECSGCELK